MNFETSVRIVRPVEEVFDYVSDPRNLPRWNSAVRDVRQASPEGGGVGSTYLMDRELPGGRAENELEIVGFERPISFEMRTISGPTPFIYRYRFGPDGDATILDLAADVELPGIAGALGPLAARGVKRGVDANFATLKQILEQT
jgi:uncharacterized protein YndB with AHSA1/START domain